MNNRMPDGNTAALRQYEAEQDRLERLHDAADRLANYTAETDVNDEKVVHELLFDYEMDPSACLARCFANLDAACNGEQIGRDAIMTALHNLRREMVDERADLIHDDCVATMSEPT